jgi:Tol biopolymer transport system component
MFSRPKYWLAWGLGGTVVLLLAAVAIWFVRPTSQFAPKTAPLTNYSGLQIQPAFSPDGKQVAFAWNGEKGENFDIYVKLVSGGAPLRLTSNPAAEHHPAWSPDGRQVAFCRVLPDHFEIWSIPATGGAERKMGESAVCEGLSWSSDGKYLAFVNRIAPQAARCIFSLSVETGEKRRLTSLPDQYLGDSSPKFSPDGKILAFRRASSTDNNDIYELRVSGRGSPEGAPWRLTFRKDTIFGFDWTADGRRIVFASGDIMGGTNLWTIPATGGIPERVAVATENADALSVSRMGRRLVYQRHVLDGNIWRVGLRNPGRRPDNPAPFISSPKHDYQPSFSPDGQRIAFVSQRSGDPEIWTCDADGSHFVQLTSLRTGMFGPRWSPDGGTVGFTVIGLKSHIYVVSAKGGTPRRLMPDSPEDEWPYWSRDGRWLYFASDRSGRSEIWRMPSKGGQAVQITRHEADEEEESPDGKFIYYSKGWPLETSLWRISVKGGEEVEVLDSVHTDGRWTVGREGIYFFTPPDKEGNSEIRLLEPSTGRVRKILKTERGIFQHIMISPDGGTILYNQLDDATSDLMIVENYG